LKENQLRAAAFEKCAVQDTPAPSLCGKVEWFFQFDKEGRDHQRMQH
jgi:hypothetical protein